MRKIQVKTRLQDTNGYSLANKYLSLRFGVYGVIRSDSDSRMKYFATPKSTAVIDNPLLLRNRPKNQLVFGVQTSTDGAFYFQVPKTEAFEIVAFKGHGIIGTESMNKTIDSRRTNLFEVILKDSYVRYYAVVEKVQTEEEAESISALLREMVNAANIEMNNAMDDLAFCFQSHYDAYSKKVNIVCTELVFTSIAHLQDFEQCVIAKIKDEIKRDNESAEMLLSKLNRTIYRAGYQKYPMYCTPYPHLNTSDSIRDMEKDEFMDSLVQVHACELKNPPISYHESVHENQNRKKYARCERMTERVPEAVQKALLEYVKAYASKLEVADTVSDEKQPMFWAQGFAEEVKSRNFWPERVCMRVEGDFNVFNISVTQRGEVYCYALDRRDLEKEDKLESTTLLDKQDSEALLKEVLPLMWNPATAVSVLDLRYFEVFDGSKKVRSDVFYICK